MVTNKFKSVVFTLVAIGIGVSLALMQATRSNDRLVQPTPVNKASLQTKVVLPEQPQSTDHTSKAPSRPIEETPSPAFTSAVPTKAVDTSSNESEVRVINLGPDIDPEAVRLEMGNVTLVNIGEDLDPEKIYTGREELAPINLGPDLDPEML